MKKIPKAEQASKVDNKATEIDAVVSLKFFVEADIQNEAEAKGYIKGILLDQFNYSDIFISNIEPYDPIEDDDDDEAEGWQEGDNEV